MTTYRCTEFTLSNLFDTFYVGRSVSNELRNHNQFSNEYGDIRIIRDDFQDVYTIEITLKDSNDMRIIPYLALIDTLSINCLSTNVPSIKSQKHSFIYNDKDDLYHYLNDFKVFIPTMIVKHL